MPYRAYGEKIIMKAKGELAKGKSLRDQLNSWLNDVDDFDDDNRWCVLLSSFLFGRRRLLLLAVWSRCLIASLSMEAKKKRNVFVCVFISPKINPFNSTTTEISSFKPRPH